MYELPTHSSTENAYKILTCLESENNSRKQRKYFGSIFRSNSRTDRISDRAGFLTDLGHEKFIMPLPLPKSRDTNKKGAEAQGDQIGRIFAQWMISYQKYKYWFTDICNCKYL
jgi:hypothetical protein